MLHIQLDWHNLPNRRRVLDKIDWEVPSGCLTGVIGSNGAGKSTLLGLLSGWEVPSSGTVTWCNRALISYSPRDLARMRIYLPQAATRHVPMLTVQEIIGLGCAKDVATRATMIEVAMEWMGLTKYALVRYSELSGGEQQRVHLARCRVQLEAASIWVAESTITAEINSAPVASGVDSESAKPVEHSEVPAEDSSAIEDDMEMITDSLDSESEVSCNEEENLSLMKAVTSEASLEVKEDIREETEEIKRSPSFSAWGILDEPLQSLDVHYQKAMLAYWRDWAKHHNATLIMSLHQLDIAAQYMGAVLLLKDGKVLAAGETSQVLVPENLDRLYAPS